MRPTIKIEKPYKYQLWPSVESTDLTTRTE